MDASKVPPSTPPPSACRDWSQARPRLWHGAPPPSPRAKPPTGQEVAENLRPGARIPSQRGSLAGGPEGLAPGPAPAHPPRPGAPTVGQLAAGAGPKPQAPVFSPGPRTPRRHQLRHVSFRGVLTAPSPPDSLVPRSSLYGAVSRAALHSAAPGPIGASQGSQQPRGRGTARGS